MGSSPPRPPDEPAAPKACKPSPGRRLCHETAERHHAALPELLAFFYGTLKRGQCNHDAFCRGALRIEEASVRGSLHDLPAGYPALVVPEDDVYDVGTSDPHRDAAMGKPLMSFEMRRPEAPRVFGELFAFDDPEARLPAFDLLEGFDPEDVASPTGASSCR